MKTIITIDGPVASGKSTVAKLLAKALKFHYLTSGFFYRGLAYALLRDQLSCDLSDALLVPYLDEKRFSYRWLADGSSLFFVDNTDVTQFLKTPEIDLCASQLAQHPLVREFILHMQRAVACESSIVAEGRDLGSVVFPEAAVKFFLTADLETRAQRWMGLQKRLGNDISLQEAKVLVHQRDVRDQERKIAPLVIPQGALVIDASCKNAEDIVQEMLIFIYRG